MAQVFQCDACKGTKGVKAANLKLERVVQGAGSMKAADLCEGCTERIDAVLNPKPRGPRPVAVEAE